MYETLEWTFREPPPRRDCPGSEGVGNLAGPHNAAPGQAGGVEPHVKITSCNVLK